MGGYFVTFLDRTRENKEIKTFTLATDDPEVVDFFITEVTEKLSALGLSVATTSTRHESFTKEWTGIDEAVRLVFRSIGRRT